MQSQIMTGIWVKKMIKDLLDFIFLSMVTFAFKASGAGLTDISSLWGREQQYLCDPIVGTIGLCT